MSDVTRTLREQQVADGIVRETETTSTRVSTTETVTRAWLDGDRVHLSVGTAGTLSFGITLSDNFAPDDAEHFANLLLVLARQARAVQARKPWTGGPLSAIALRRG